MAFLLTANLAIAGIFFVKIEPTSEESAVGESVNPGLDLSNEVASPAYDCDSVGWSKNIVIMSPRKEEAEELTSTKIDEEGTKTPEIINEDNTPIFLNAVSGIFFPICHTKASMKNYETEEAFSKLFTWQKSYYRIQVVIFDIVILSVIGVIYILVTSVDTFNYNFNVLNLFWFKMGFLFLVLMGTLTFLLSLDINLAQLCSQIPCSKENSVDVCRDTYICLLAILLISLPAIVGIISFNISTDQTPLLVFAKGNQQEVVVMGSVVIRDRWDHSLDSLQGRIWTGCQDYPYSASENILVINMTDIKCLDISFVAQYKDNISAIVILDTSPVLRWRVSSPYPLHDKVEMLMSSLPHILVLMVRTQDWANHLDDLKNEKKLTVSRTKSIDWQELNMFSCNFQAGVTIPLVPGQSKEVQTDNRKTNTATLHKDGRITQNLFFTVKCTFYGEKCKWKVNPEEDLPVTCKNITSGHIQPYSGERNTPLTRARIGLHNNKTHSTCCRNSHTWVEIFAEYQQVVPVDILTKDCSFTDFIKEDCDRGFGQLKQVRFCSQGNFIISQYTRNLCLTGEIVFNTCDLRQHEC